MSTELDQYNFSYPQELIAQVPANPRDAARLFVYDRATGEIIFDIFKNLEKYLPAKSVIVLNKTKVIPARLWTHKPTGGKVQIFYLAHDATHVRALSPDDLSAGTVLMITPRLALTVVEKEGNQYVLTANFPLSHMMTVLDKYGTTPIPPYIKHSPLSEQQLRREYQAVFAKVRGSVAAPTASLHFTPSLIKAVKAAGHGVHYTTLHVGLGTFAPLTADQLLSGRLHQEHYEIDAHTARAINRAKQAGRPIVAVGTTVARTLESASDATGELTALSGDTDLFIREGYRWRFVDSLVTNFHVPQSSLLMLVASMIDRPKLLELYQQAIAQQFRLFSFGDGMLIK